MKSSEELRSMAILLFLFPSTETMTTVGFLFSRFCHTRPGTVYAIKPATSSCSFLWPLLILLPLLLLRRLV